MQRLFWLPIFLPIIYTTVESAYMQTGYMQKTGYMQRLFWLPLLYFALFLIRVYAKVPVGRQSVMTRAMNESIAISVSPTTLVPQNIQR